LLLILLRVLSYNLILAVVAKKSPAVRKLNANHSVHRSQLPVLVLGKMTRDRIFPLYFININCYLTFQAISSLKAFALKFCLYLSSFPCNIHSILLITLILFWSSIYVTKLLIKQLNKYFRQIWLQYNQQYWHRVVAEYPGSNPRQTAFCV
jgi:hypothetical protein